MEHQGLPAAGPAAPSVPQARHIEIVVLEDGLQDVTFADGSDRFDDLLLAIGEQPGPALPSDEPGSPAAVARELARKDATIAGLRSLLEGLRPLAEESARSLEARQLAEQRAAAAERELGALRVRLQECEASLAESTAAAEALRASGAEKAEQVASLRERMGRLELRLRQRTGVLTRERERHAATRAKLAERSKVASERWQELRRLRAQGS